MATMISAKVIADSISEAGKRITTLQLCYPRFIHSEFMTHRVFSRNASSSRAIPVAKMIEQVRNDPAMPVHWGKNQPGMQAHEELTGSDLEQVQITWREAALDAADKASYMNSRGAHKQVINRILEPFQWIHVVLTATEFDNWDELRDHTDADPTIHELARQIKIARAGSTPKLLLSGEWHLPYVTDEDYDAVARYRREAMGMSDLEAWDDEGITEMLCRVSAARCCRVSYLKHDGHPSTVGDDLLLCDRLAGARPIHASPFEHQAAPMFGVGTGFWTLDNGARKAYLSLPKGASHIDMDGNVWSGNLNGWIQHRKVIEQSFK